MSKGEFLGFLMVNEESLIEAESGKGGFFEEARKAVSRVDL